MAMASLASTVRPRIDPRHGMVVHGSALYQLLMGFVRTDRFIEKTAWS